MLSSLASGFYSSADNALHRADPRSKIAATLLVVVVAYLLNTLPMMLFLLAILLCAFRYVGKPIILILRGLKPIFWLAAIAVFINSISIQGSSLISGQFNGSVPLEAISVSAKLLLRLLTIAIAASLLTMTTSPFSLARGISSLLIPLKRFGVPTSDIAAILQISLRILPVIVEESNKLIVTAGAETAGAGKPSIHKRIKLYSGMLLQLFSSVALRGEAIAEAMEARCYRGSAFRTDSACLSFKRSDFAGLASLTMLLVVILIME